MRAVFDGIELAPGGYDPEQTWLASARLRGSQAVQTSSPVRAGWKRHLARGAREHEISLIFIPPPAENLDAAVELLALYFASLPQSGALTIESGAVSVSWQNAVLTSFAPPPRRGVSNEFPLTFLAGAPDESLTLSTLAQMNQKYVANLPAITGMTGGGASNLDGLTTLDVTPGLTVFVCVTVSGVTRGVHFRLTAATTAENTNPESGPLIIRPDDYNADSNAKVWAEI